MASPDPPSTHSPPSTEDIVGFDDNITARTARGVAWTFGGQIATQVVRFGLGVALARILLPEDFGLIAMIGVFTGFAAALADAGMSAAIVQRPSVTGAHLRTAYWLNVAVGGGLAVLTVAIAYPLAVFFDEPRLMALTVAIAPIFVVNAFAMVHRALLTRGLKFRLLASAELAAATIGGLSAVAAAMAGLGTWSLVVQTLMTGIVAAAAVIYWSPWEARLGLDRGAARELWSFGSSLTGFTFVNYGTRNVDNILIGRFLGPDALGIYGRAYGLMLLPLTQVTHAVGRVMFPAMSRVQRDPQRISRAYLRTISVIALVTFPAMAGLTIVAGSFVEAVYGPKWLAVTPVLRILALVGLIQSVNAATGWIFMALGRTGVMFKLAIVKFISTALAFAIGLRWGVVGVAAAYGLHVLLWTVPTLQIAGGPIKAGYRAVARSVRGPAGLSFLMMLIVLAAGVVIPGHFGPTLRLAIQAAVGIVAYVPIAWHLPAAKEARDVVVTLRKTPA